MASTGKVIVVALCGALAGFGLGLGSESQEEVFLEPDLDARDAANASGASGNLVLLTAVLVALAAAVGGSLLSGRRALRRFGLALALFLSTYFAIVVAQSSWPNYDAQLEARYADLSNTLMAANVPAVPSVLLPVLALAVGTVLATGWSLRHLFGRAPPLADAAEALQRHVALTLLAAPFLAIAAWGNVALLVALPHDRPGLGPYLAVLPLGALACLGLLAILLAKAWRLGSFVRNARLGPSVQESWTLLGRAESVLAGLVAALVLLAALFQAADLPGLALGRVFAVTLRGHTQLLVFLAIPMAPALAQHRAIQRFLGRAPGHRATLETGTDPLAAWAVVASVASLVLAGAVGWLADEALWAWLAALLPVAALAFARCGAVRSAPVVLLLAFVLWAIGNTVVAQYEGGRDATLVFRDAPGVLALWRALGALVGGLALARLALAAAPDEPRASAVPMALGAGACLAAVALLEMPLSAWLLNRGEGEAIAVGSVMASLDRPVRVLLHALAGVLTVGAALLIARLRRPDWFRPPPAPPLPAPVRSKSRAGKAASRVEAVGAGTGAEGAEGVAAAGRPTG